MTAGTLIYEAMERIRCLRPGQTAATTETADALAALNNLLDSWSTERLLVLFVSPSRYALTAAQAVYTIGPTGANLTGPRPIRIDAAGIVQLAYNSGTGDFRTPLDIISERDWVAIADKTATADVPKKLYYAPTIASGWGTLNLWPIPNVSSSTDLEISAWVALASFPDLTTDVPLAPGYARALATNLAIEIAPRMPGSQLDQATIAEAQESKAYIMKLNALMVPDSPDIAIPPATDSQFRPVPSTLGAAVRLSQPNTQAAIQAAEMVK